MPRVIGPRPRSKATRQAESRQRFQLSEATTITTVEGSRMATSAPMPLTSPQSGPSRMAAPMPSRPTSIELGPGAASAMA